MGAERTARRRGADRTTEPAPQSTGPVAASGAVDPASLLRLQRTAGNQAVQRVLYDTGTRTYTSGGQQVGMELNAPGANCHGFTYDTFAEARPHNPLQDSPEGVTRVVGAEAGSELASMQVKLWREGEPQGFDGVTPKAGNLIVVWRGGTPVHSAEVTGGESGDFTQFTVMDKQGYQGKPADIPMRYVRQAGAGNVVKLYERTPKTEERSDSNTNQ